MSTRSNTPLPRRPLPQSRAAPNSGLRLRQVLAAGASTGGCVKKTFDCHYCDMDAYYMWAQKLTKYVAACLTALGLFVLNPQLPSPTTATDVLTKLGAQMREAVVIVPSVQEWWRHTSKAIKQSLSMPIKHREPYPLFSSEIGFDAHPFWVTFLRPEDEKVPWYLRIMPTEQQEDFLRAIGLLMMTFTIARKIVYKHPTIGQIVTSINEGPERWIRLLAGFFRGRAAQKEFGGEMGKQWNNFSYYVFKATTDVLRNECDEPEHDQGEVYPEQLETFVTQLLVQQDPRRPLLLTWKD